MVPTTLRPSLFRQSLNMIGAKSQRRTYFGSHSNPPPMPKTFTDAGLTDEKFSKAGLIFEQLVKEDINDRDYEKYIPVVHFSMPGNVNTQPTVKFKHRQRKNENKTSGGAAVSPTNNDPKNDHLNYKLYRRFTLQEDLQLMKAIYRPEGISNQWESISTEVFQRRLPPKALKRRWCLLRPQDSKDRKADKYQSTCSYMLGKGNQLYNGRWVNVPRLGDLTASAQFINVKDDTKNDNGMHPLHAFRQHLEAVVQQNFNHQHDLGKPYSHPEKWMKEEIMLLKAALEYVGPKWDYISKALDKRRSPSDCRAQAYEILKQLGELEASTDKNT